MTKYTKFGVEFEFASDACRTSFCRNMKVPGLKVVDAYAYSYNELKRRFKNHWHLKEDGSVYGNFIDDNGWSSGGEGLELVSPILHNSKKGFEQVKLALQAVHKTCYNIEVNETCGFHVHVDLGFAKKYSPIKREAFFKHMIAEYAKREERFDKRMDETRWYSYNEYCQSMKGFDYRNIRDNDRYFKLNLCAYQTHGTVEFRHHHGTLSYSAASRWIRTCIYFVKTCRKQFETNWNKQMKKKTPTKKGEGLLMAA